MCTLTRYYCLLAASALGLLFMVENTLPKASASHYPLPIHYDCGPPYLEIKANNETGFISSPNHPRSYPGQVRCIWILKAPLGCHVQLSLHYIRGQSTMTGTCIDYLEVRSRSRTKWRPVLRSCHLVNPAVVVSDERFLSLKFVSDESNSSEGFYAEWSVACDDVCSSHEYSCPNLECILIGYLCDERNDCGCTTVGCDEVDCPRKTNLTEAERFGIIVIAALLSFLLLHYGSKFLMMIQEKLQQRRQCDTSASS